MADDLSFRSMGIVFRSVCGFLKKKGRKKQKSVDVAEIENRVDDVDDEEEIYSEQWNNLDDMMWGILMPNDSNVMTDEILNRKMINCCRGVLGGEESFEDFSRKGTTLFLFFVFSLSNINLAI